MIQVSPLLVGRRSPLRAVLIAGGSVASGAVLAILAARHLDADADTRQAVARVGILLGVLNIPVLVTALLGRSVLRAGGLVAATTLFGYGLALSLQSPLLVFILAHVGLWCGCAMAPLLVPVTTLFPAGQCQACGYDLRGNTSGRCPECGHPAHSIVG